MDHFTLGVIRYSATNASKLSRPSAAPPLSLLIAKMCEHIRVYYKALVAYNAKH